MSSVCSMLTTQRLGRSFLKGYYSKFRNRLFSCLPADFASGFKQVCTELLEPADEMDEDGEPVANNRSNFELTPEQATLWQNLSALGLIERFESTVAAVGYEYIERYILDKCKGEWERPMLNELRNWMTGRVVPWMLHIYAREATTGTTLCPPFERSLTELQRSRLSICCKGSARDSISTSTRPCVI